MLQPNGEYGSLITVPPLLSEFHRNVLQSMEELRSAVANNTRDPSTTEKNCESRDGSKREK
jgi:hypothetical protein